MTTKLDSFTDVLGDPDEICSSQPNLYSQPLSLSSVEENEHPNNVENATEPSVSRKARSHSLRPLKGTDHYGEFRSVNEIDEKYRHVFSFPFFNLVQSRVIEDALYSDKSMVVCAPTGSGKTVVFEMAIVHLLMELEDRNENRDFKIIYMAPVKALCTERLTEWYSKFTKLGLLCVEVTGDTDVDFSQLKPYRIIITTPEKWDMLTRRWRDHRQLVEVIKLFLIDEVHILNDETRGPVLEAVVSRMKTIETSVQSTHRIEQLQQLYSGAAVTSHMSPSIRFVAVSATVSNPEDVAAWLGTQEKPAVYHKFGDECRPVKLKRVVEGYHCAEGTSIFKFDLVLNYKLWPIIQKYHNGKSTLIFCNTRKSVAMTAETLSREITISFNDEQKARLTALASTIKTKKLQTLVLSGVGCHHAGLLYEERTNIEKAFRNRDLPILITTTTLAMGVNLPAHLVIIKNTQQYVNGAYQEYSISTVLQMVGRAGRPQFDTEATAVIMTRMADKQRYQALVGGCEPLQSYLHKRLPENLNSEAALGTVTDVAQCVQWLRSTFLCVRAAKDPKRYLGLPQTAPHFQISKKIEELCVKAMNGLASSGMITMDEACCIESTEAGRLMSIFYLDLETMKHIMKINGTESLERLLWIICESHELSDMHLRIDERRCLNALNRNNAAATIRFPMKGKITTRQMKLSCVIQAILGCLPIPDPSLNQEAMKVMRIADRICKCLVAYVTSAALISQQPKYYSAVLNSIILAKCIAANLWENSEFVSKQLKGIGPTFSTLLASAGKVNFMLLEESHPRDLERIMNKGPPAGNIIRKQISLFPKYQLTMTPVDEKKVSIQLNLLNHHNLSEKIEHLTAGATHKSYIVIGDSENTLLLFTSFRDIDLIAVYHGTITYQVARKHGFEHKLYAHCISSTFAGIDTQCEYVFKDIEPPMHVQLTDWNDDLVKKQAKKQTTITDTFRERKRKSSDNELTHSKEKKKRESALFEKFKNLKESFGKTSKLLKDDLNKSAVMTEKILQEFTYLEKPSNLNDSSTENVSVPQNADINNQTQVASTFFEEPMICDERCEFNNDDFMDDSKINLILNEIENEISKESDKPANVIITKDNNYMPIVPRPESLKGVPYCTVYPKIEKYKVTSNKRPNKSFPKKTNYNFIDLLEKNVDLSDTEDTTVPEQNSFSDTIKSHIEKYLQKAKTNIEPPNTIVDIIQNKRVPSKESEALVVIHDSNVRDRYNEKDFKIGHLDTPTTKVVDTDGKVTVKQVSALQDGIKNIDDILDENNDYQLLELDNKNNCPMATLTENIEQDDDANNVIKTDTQDFAGNNHDKSNISLVENNVISTNLNTMLKESQQTDELNNSQFVSKNIENDYTVQSNEAEITNDSDNKISNHIPEGTKMEQIMEIETIPLTLEEPKKIDTTQIELQAHNHPILNTMGIENGFEQQSRQDIKLPIDVSSYYSIPELNKIQQLRAMELWKNYIKELPQLKSNSQEGTVHATHDSANKTTLINQSDINKHLSTVSDNMKLAVTAPLIHKGFIPPFKNYTNDLKLKIQNKNTLQVVLQTPLPLQKQNLLNIDDHIGCHKQHNEIAISNKSFNSQTISNQLNNTITQHFDEPGPHITDLKIYDNDKRDTIEDQPLEMSKEHAPTQQEQVPNEIESLIFNKVSAINSPSTSNNGNRLKGDSSYIYTRSQNNVVNKLSISTNKINVSTQEKADHIVRVIRKLKIDFDITEIITENKKNVESCETLKEDVNFHQEDTTVAQNKSKHVLTEDFELCAGITESYQKVPKLTEYSCTILKTTDALIKEAPPAHLSNETKPVETEKDEREKEIEEDSKTVRNISIEDFQKEKQPNNVRNILEKYSSIMRNARSITDINLVTTKANEKFITASNDRPKRPFKISEIDRVNSPLPTVMMENPIKVNVSECFNLLEPKNKQAKLEKNKLIKICAATISPLKVHEIQELSREQEFKMDSQDVTESMTYDETLEDNPFFEVEKPISDFDQSMLNPKALLQCFSKDESEDIVPPPPEFCDNFNSIPLDTNNDETLFMNYYEPITCDEEIMDISREDSNCIFEDNEQFELTPSKEIETWKLSQEESNSRIYASPATSPYTFTIMRKNKETPKPTSVLKSTLPRHKLNQFKFNHKEKFKR